MKALSYASLDKEDLLSPINQNTLQRSSSVRSMVSNATYGSSDDYIGLALPVDINEIFQVCIWYYKWVYLHSLMKGSELLHLHRNWVDLQKRGKQDVACWRNVLWKYSRLAWMSVHATCCREAALVGGWTWYIEVPSNPYDSVIASVLPVEFLYLLS